MLVVIFFAVSLSDSIFIYLGCVVMESERPGWEDVQCGRRPSCAAVAVSATVLGKAARRYDRGGGDQDMHPNSREVKRKGCGASTACDKKG